MSSKISKSRVIDKIGSASAAQLRSIFIKLQLKVVNCSSHIFFLKECVRLRLTPSFVQYNVKCCFPFLKTKIEKWMRDKWIRAEIRRWHGLKPISYCIMLTHV